MTNFDDFLAEVHTVAIGGHIRPDGDCVGSCLATYNYIKTWYPDIDVTVYLEPIPNIFKFMARSNEIVSDFSGDTVYDLFIAQDCGDTGRLGGAAHFFEQAKHTVCVDHHISNQSFAQDNYIFPQASSASELVYELLPKERITKEIAECIYTGMVHDTGVFQYSCTSRKTMEIAGALMECGINYPKIVDDTFYTKTYNQNRIMGLALLKSRLHLNGKCISSVITEEEHQIQGSGGCLDGGGKVRRRRTHPGSRIFHDWRCRCHHRTDCFGSGRTDKVRKKQYDEWNYQYL